MAKSLIFQEKKRINIRFLALIFLILSSIAGGTVVYSTLEGWSLLDSLYFSTVTLTTVGYGDLHPTKPSSKIFTIFFVLVGVALMLYALSILGRYYIHYIESYQSGFKSGVKNAIGKIYPRKKKPERWIRLKVKKKED